MINRELPFYLKVGDLHQMVSRWLTLKRLDRNDLIILDDFVLVAMNADTRIALLQILEDRNEKFCHIIVSQLPIDKWYDYIAEATLADMVRLVNSSNLIKLDGPSMRQRRVIQAVLFEHYDQQILIYYGLETKSIHKPIPIFATFPKCFIIFTTKSIVSVSL